MSTKTLRMLLGLVVVAAPLAMIGCDEEKKADVKPAAPAAGTDTKPIVPATPAEKK